MATQGEMNATATVADGVPAVALKGITLAGLRKLFKWVRV